MPDNTAMTRRGVQGLSQTCFRPYLRIDYAMVHTKPTFTRLIGPHRRQHPCVWYLACLPLALCWVAYTLGNSFLPIDTNITFRCRFLIQSPPGADYPSALGYSLALPSGNEPVSLVRVHGISRPPSPCPKCSCPAPCVPAIMLLLCLLRVCMRPQQDATVKEIQHWPTREFLSIPPKKNPPLISVSTPQFSYWCSSLLVAPLLLFHMTKFPSW